MSLKGGALAAVAVVVAALAVAPVAEAASLRAGVGRADITPQTGYYLGGWTRADRTSKGQHTRLFASALVLQRGQQKVALVAVDLFMVAGGMAKQAAEAAGMSQSNVLISASHTHSGPGGFANFSTYNTAAPSIETVTDPISFYRLLDPLPADSQLYTFLVQRIAIAIRRAERNVGPAALGWGEIELHGLTQNRSIEAHLADHGILLGYGHGNATMDPLGVAHTIDPEVNVLRVDRVRRGRRVPIGAWSTFAAHGTVTKSTFEYYNEDHHASALRVFEAGVRRAGHVPRRRPVVNVFGNTDEGDQSAGLDRSGPAASDYVGRVEAAAMLHAWRRAGRHLTRRPVLDLRWTRVCFCGQQVDGGRVGSSPVIGVPFLTGSEEGRGPLYDETHVPLEGVRSPLEDPVQGHKIGVPAGDAPHAVPLLAIRAADRVIVSFPGEATAEVGRRLRRAVLTAASPEGVHRVVVSGLANEYLSYFTTPEEYERQHYEGGSTLYGRLASPFLTAQLVDLSRRLVLGQPAPPAYPFDPTNGVRPDGPPYGQGAARGVVQLQPKGAYGRFRLARFGWRGGRLGLDRPLDRAFVAVQRHTRRGWRQTTSDLGLEMLWAVDDDGNYRATWDIPRWARAGTYRMVVRAKRYTLTSASFRVGEITTLQLVRVHAAPGRVAVEIRYPQAVRDVNLNYRPDVAVGGVVRFRVGDRDVTVRRRDDTSFSVAAPPDVPVSVPPGDAEDRYGNVAGFGLRLQG